LAGSATLPELSQEALPPLRPPRRMYSPLASEKRPEPELPRSVVPATQAAVA
jgi:hypothetical protein